MARNTGIEWTDDTWNPIRGCSRVSEGCRHCYAEQVAYRFSGPGQGYEGLVQIGADGKRRAQWNGQIKFVESHLLDPLRWGPVVEHTRDCDAEWALAHPGRTLRCRRACNCPTRRRRIFVNSMGDVFHGNVTNEMIDRIFVVMALSPQHDYQILTKQPERMHAWFSEHYNVRSPGAREMAFSYIRHLPGYSATDSKWMKMAANAFDVWPLRNVWLGVSVENQSAADERIPILLETPAALHFISAEPLLGPLDIRRWLGLECRHEDSYSEDETGATVCSECESESVLGWAIAGGESGRAEGVRPMHPGWVRDLRDQCASAGAQFFFKQWGEWSFRECVEETRGDELGTLQYFQEIGATFFRVGKKVTGALLDGVEHKVFPEVSR